MAPSWVWRAGQGLVLDPGGVTVASCGTALSKEATFSIGWLTYASVKIAGR